MIVGKDIKEYVMVKDYTKFLRDLEKLSKKYKITFAEIITLLRHNHLGL